MRQVENIAAVLLMIYQYILGHDHWHADIFFLHVIYYLFKYLATGIVKALYFVGKYRVDSGIADLFYLFRNLAHSKLDAALFQLQYKSVYVFFNYSFGVGKF